MHANDLLMGGGVKSAAFPDQQYGTTVGGPIVRPPTVSQQRDFDTNAPLTWDDGSPRLQIVVHVQTDQRDPADPQDDGVRAFYIKAQMQQAVRDAVRAAGAKGLDVGGHLHITYTRDEPNSRGRGKPKKVYSARYVPPAAQAANDALMGAPPPAATYAQPGFSPAAPTQAAPPGVDPGTWASLGPEQRQAVLAAMSAQSSTTASFDAEPPF